VLKFENVVGVVERLPHQTEPHWANARQHVCILPADYAFGCLRHHSAGGARPSPRSGLSQFFKGFSIRQHVIESRTGVCRSW
jgi:hypothetical protein